MQDLGIVAKYYGVLAVYGATPYELGETNSYNVLYQETVENDWTKYGEMETIHKEFPIADERVAFYYDMISGSKGLNSHELAHKWVKDLGTRKT